MTTELRTVTSAPVAADLGISARWMLPLTDRTAADERAYPAPDGDDDHTNLTIVTQDVLDDVADPNVLGVVGRFLGVGTSWQPQHVNHSDTAHVERGVRCNACRWFEVRLFRYVDAPHEYVVYKIGQTAVDSEVPFYSYDTAYGAYELVELLTERRRINGTDRYESFITKPSARALAQAASYDDDLQAAYIDRAVS